MTEGNDYYVYAHIGVNSGRCFYIGKGRNGRHRNGMSGRNNDWVDKVEAEGGFRWKILVSGLTHKKALEIEKDFIAQVGIESLLNKTQKGKKLGFIPSKAFKPGHNTWNKGIKMWENRTHPRGTLGIKPWNKGKEVDYTNGLENTTLDSETGVFYDSFTKACKATNINRNSEKSRIQRNQKHRLWVLKEE